MKVLRDELSQDSLANRLAKITLIGDSEEVASNFDSLNNIMLCLKKSLDEIVEELDDRWLLHKDAGSQKEFAGKVKNHPLKHILFMANKGKIKSQDEIFKHIWPKFLIDEAKKRYPVEYQKSISKALDWQKSMVAKRNKTFVEIGANND
jgi:hypothetical protein